jgi:hypothetical protein
MMRLDGKLNWLTSAIVGIAFLGAGCSEESPTAPATPTDTGTETEIETDLIDPAAVIAAHTRALAERNAVAYAALLDSEFQFYARGESVAGGSVDFPWLQTSTLPNPWGRAQELQLIERLLNEDYIETYQDEVVLEGAETVHFEATVLDVRPIENEQIEVYCACRGYVVTTPVDMFVFRSRLLFTLIPREGFLRILKVIESEEPGVAQWKLWGTVKGYYN